MSEEEIKKIHEIVKNKKLKLYIHFSGVKYSLVINKNIFPEDKTTGINVKWFQAFGNKSLKDLFKSYKIEKILIIKGNEEIAFNSLKDALIYLEKH